MLKSGRYSLFFRYSPFFFKLNLVDCKCIFKMPFHNTKVLLFDKRFLYPFIQSTQHVKHRVLGAL